MAADCFFNEELTSSLGDVGGVLKRAVAALIRDDWIEPEQEFYARLCLEEALVNAVTHGNASDPHKKVRLLMNREGDLCTIRVYDEGGGFMPERVYLPEPDQENGRGICLIRYCMDNVRYDRAERCLIMKMRRKALCKGGP